MEIMLQPREMDHCLREIYNFQREFYNFYGNWIIASGNFPFAVEKMIFPVGDELFPMRNYVMPRGNYVLLAAVNFFLLEIILRSFANTSLHGNELFLPGKEPPLTGIIKFPWKLAAHLQEKGLRLIEIEAFPMEMNLSSCEKMLLLYMK